jgi:hypothetical protein
MRWSVCVGTTSDRVVDVRLQRQGPLSIHELISVLSEIDGVVSVTAGTSFEALAPKFIQRSGGKGPHEPPLPWSLDRMPRVVLSHVVDCSVTRYTVQDGETSKCGAGAPTSVWTGHLDAFGLRARPCLAEDGGSSSTIER